MDYQLAFNIVLGISAFLGGWLINRVTTAIDRLDKDIRDLPHTYVSKNDYHNDMKEVKDMLSKIFDKLDGKADK